jgi:hypothetical protein
LNRKLSNSTTNQQKKIVWSNITEKVNALEVASRNPSEVRDKWRNITSKAECFYPASSRVEENNRWTCT